jgi:hypothetical protein
VLVDVAEISSMTVRMVVSGRPRQLMVMKLKRRCSIFISTGPVEPADDLALCVVDMSPT